jgi:6-phosphofructokinase 1
MGRGSGYLALQTGLATGAMGVVIPEEGYHKEELLEKIRRGRVVGKTHHIVVVSEGVEGGGQRIVDDITNELGLAARLTVLGHIQRGGSPTVWTGSRT